MKDAKTITEFVKNVCFHYSICYSAYFFDYDENDQLVPTPIFEDDLVTPGKLNYLSKLLGMSTEDIANADNKASIRQKLSYKTKSENDIIYSETERGI